MDNLLCCSKLLVAFLVCMLVIFGCKKPNYYQMSSYADGVLQAVIEIPAGSHVKTEYVFGEGFRPDTLSGKPRVIQFLPYPANYGFIPGTLMDRSRGGDGDALDVLVIGKQVKTGTILPVIPVAVLQLDDAGELDTKIIAVPHEESLSVIKARTYVDLMIHYPAIKDILSLWFSNYEGYGQNEVLGWENEQFAVREISKWRINSQGKE